ncbi:hypothetical protein HPP92_023759 [Vanilla planifolia]|uniref:P53 and DNA damage-regulated protein 1 n=1 Tax=Vanilla planifolia TaxID=51239 RepID=A0A835PQQ9_VANPL|nr:hypothetical protein HPP92_023759 [Vanilla planifolia]
MEIIENLGTKIKELKNCVGNFEIALCRRAHTTKSSIPSRFEKFMNDLSGADLVPLVKEIYCTCGDHDPKELTWMMFPGFDIFAWMPFHVVHTVLDKDQEKLEHETKSFQSYVKKSITISQTGALVDRINPVIFLSLVSLKDECK